MDQVRASLLDPDNQGELPFRNKLLQDGASRTLLLQALADRMKDPDAVDWPIDAYAMIALDWKTGNADKIAPLLADLGKRSPYLARSATAALFFFRHQTRSPWRLLAQTRYVLANNHNFLGPDVPELYTWALSKVLPVARSLQMVSANQLPDPQLLLTSAPYAELVVLKGGQIPADADPADVAPGANDSAGQ
jgi:hypothetical protein